MNALIIMVALAAHPAVGADAGEFKSPQISAVTKRQSAGHSMPAEVRALFGDLIEPVTGTEAHWSVPVFDRRATSDIFLVTIAKELPKSIAGVQISRLSTGASMGEQSLVVVGSGGTHLVIAQHHGHLGVFGGNSCGRGVGGLSLGSDGAIEWRACWNEALRRFEIKRVDLPQLDDR